MASRLAMIADLREVSSAVLYRACEALGFPHGRTLAEFTDSEVARLHAWTVWNGTEPRDGDDVPKGTAHAD